MHEELIYFIQSHIFMPQPSPRSSVIELTLFILLLLLVLWAASTSLELVLKVFFLIQISLLVNELVVKQ